MKESKCMYCGSHNYGQGCPYAPHKIHVHPDNPKKCIYCGSYNVGQGCPYNPFGKVHVHGIDYNQMVRDSVENSITAGYLIKKLSMPICETPAYKLNLIDETGRVIKKPETVQECAALTTLDKYVFDLKQLVGSKLNLINGTLYLEKQDTIKLSEYHDLYEKEVEIKVLIEKNIKELNKIVNDSYQKGLSTATIEKLILEAFKNENV